MQRAYLRFLEADGVENRHSFVSRMALTRVILGWVLVVFAEAVAASSSAATIT